MFRSSYNRYSRSSAISRFKVIFLTVLSAIIGLMVFTLVDYFVAINQNAQHELVIVKEVNFTVDEDGFRDFYMTVSNVNTGESLYIEGPDWNIKNHLGTEGDTVCLLIARGINNYIKSE